MDTVAARLPEIHPGTPGYVPIGVQLCVIEETGTILRVQLPDVESRTISLPRSHCWTFGYVKSVVRHVPGTKQINFQVCHVRIPAWLYARIKDTF